MFQCKFGFRQFSLYSCFGSLWRNWSVYLWLPILVRFQFKIEVAVVFYVECMMNMWCYGINSWFLTKFRYAFSLVLFIIYILACTGNTDSIFSVKLLLVLLLIVFLHWEISFSCSNENVIITMDDLNSHHCEFGVCYSIHL